MTDAYAAARAFLDDDDQDVDEHPLHEVKNDSRRSVLPPLLECSQGINSQWEFCTGSYR